MDSAHLPPDLLGDYAEGLLDPSARRAADAHLEACGGCRQALAATREYFSEMAGLEPFKAPDRFLTRVHARIDRRSPWKRALAVLSSPRFLPVPLAGLSAVLVGVYLVLAPQLRQEAPPTVAMAEPSAVAPKERSRADAAEAAGSPKAAPVAKAKARVAPVAKPAAPVASDSKPAASADYGFADRIASGPRDAAEMPIAKTEARGEGKDAPRESEALTGLQAAEARSESQVLANSGSMDEDVSSQRGAPAPAAASPRSSDFSSLSLEEDDGDARAESADREALAFKRRAGSSGKKAEAPPPATTPMPWAPEDYTVKRKSDGAGSLAKAGSGADDLAKGLTKLGARILRFEGGAVARYELELPAARLPDLEAFLRGYGALIPSTRPRPDQEAAKTRRLVLRVERAP